jgi:2-polyprenyl-6-methoxyphenol hydroxylase-like FAD-dependent oxidoreductase
MTYSSKQHLGAHAVVIGGSIAGLATARILSDYFSKVTVIERDPSPQSPEARKSVPQMRHAHVLLGAANLTLERMYPGIITQMEQAGALLIDSAADLAMYQYGGWKPRFVAGFQTLNASRPFLEWHVRRRTEAITNIEIRYEHVVDRLLTTSSGDRVTGVVVKCGADEMNLLADLVVDAAGRGTRAPRWLEAMGYERPFEQEVKVDLAYTSRIYEKPANFAGDWRGLGIYSRLPGHRAAFVFEVEHGRWIVSFPGYFKDHCPTDEEGLLAYARSLPVPDAYEAIRHAKPLTDIVIHKIPSSRWFRYDKMKRFPERFVAIGDSVSSLNPAFGQGMLVSLQGVDKLSLLLAERARKRKGLYGLPLEAQMKIADVVLPAWLLSTTMDLRYAQTVGERPFGISAVQGVFVDMLDMTSMNEDACRVFYDMLHMRRGPEALLDRRMLLPLVKYIATRPFIPLEKRIHSGPRPAAPT